MNPKIKYGIIAIAWILYLLIGLSGDDSSDNKTKQANEDNKSIWAEDYTSIKDFDYYIDGNKLYCNKPLDNGHHCGGEIDYTKTSNIIIDEFRKSVIGNISLERPGD